jgi:hypothetical protein
VSPDPKPARPAAPALKLYREERAMADTDAGIDEGTGDTPEQWAAKEAAVALRMVEMNQRVAANLDAIITTLEADREQHTDAS